MATTSAALKPCSKYKEVVRYRRDCQAKHWKAGGHRLVHFFLSPLFLLIEKLAVQCLLLIPVREPRGRNDAPRPVQRSGLPPPGPSALAAQIF